MRKALLFAVPLLLGSVILGATVLREPIAWAATIKSVIVANDATKPVPVKIDQSQNTVKIDPSSPAIQVQTQPFHRYVFVPSPASAGGKSCVPFGIPAGMSAYVRNVSVSTYADPGAVAYLRFFVKEGSSTSRIVTAVIPTAAVGNDPVVNSRSGTIEWGVHVEGGTVFDVQLEDVHSINACVQSSGGQSATGTVMLDGDLG